MQKQKPDHHQTHQPVLLESVLEYLKPKAGESYLDLTAGYGGHAAKILELTKAPKKAVLVDRDQEAIDYLKTQFGKDSVQLMHTDFYSAAKTLLEQGRTFDLILADLGLSSPHLDNASRGFSFKRPGPLDMRMDQNQDLTANQVVNNWNQADLAHIFRLYGEEPKAGKAAEAVVNNRPISSTKHLSEVLASVLPFKRGKTHPATRIFQALRIAVNNELELLNRSLPLLIELLSVGGRIVVISFHSLEDRAVKQALKDKAEGKYSAEIEILTPSPVSPSAKEIAFNPRARSARLRSAVKNKNKEGAYSAYPGKK